MRKRVEDEACIRFEQLKNSTVEGRLFYMHYNSWAPFSLHILFCMEIMKMRVFAWTKTVRPMSLNTRRGQNSRLVVLSPMDSCPIINTKANNHATQLVVVETDKTHNSNSTPSLSLWTNTGITLQPVRMWKLNSGDIFKNVIFTASMWSGLYYKLDFEELKTNCLKLMFPFALVKMSPWTCPHICSTLRLSVLITSLIHFL